MKAQPAIRAEAAEAINSRSGAPLKDHTANRSAQGVLFACYSATRGQPACPVCSKLAVSYPVAVCGRAWVWPRPEQDGAAALPELPLPSLHQNHC